MIWNTLICFKYALFFDNNSENKREFINFNFGRIFNELI